MIWEILQVKYILTSFNEGLSCIFSLQFAFNPAFINKTFYRFSDKLIRHRRYLFKNLIPFKNKLNRGENRNYFLYYDQNLKNAFISQVFYNL